MLVFNYRGVMFIVNSELSISPPNNIFITLNSGGYGRDRSQK